MKRITLPAREEMLSKLIAAESSNHIVQNFYPKLLDHAGQGKVACGVAVILNMAIIEYCDSAILLAAMQLRAPEFIDALIDDAEVAAEAKMHFAKMAA
jgi:hypothetical protein